MLLAYEMWRYLVTKALTKAHTTTKYADNVSDMFGVEWMEEYNSGLHLTGQVYCMYLINW